MASHRLSELEQSPRRRRTSQKTGGNITSDPNIDLLGQVNLLRALQKAGIISETDLRKITARLAVKNGASIIFLQVCPVSFYSDPRPLWYCVACKSRTCVKPFSILFHR